MSNQRSSLLLVVIVTALVLVAAACGSGSDVGPTSSEVPPLDDTEVLPPVDDGSVETPVASGACLPGEPECEDTLVGDPEVNDLPDVSDAESSSGSVAADTVTAMTVNGGLTISEALSTDAAGILAVRGHLFDEGAGLRLCESLVGVGERYGCEGDHLPVTNVDLDAIAEITFFEGATYTEDEITLFGELIDGSLVVDPLVAG
jgi:hypothetical protein